MTVEEVDRNKNLLLRFETDFENVQKKLEN